MESKDRKESIELNGLTVEAKDDSSSSDKSDTPMGVGDKREVPTFKSLFHYPRGTYFCLGNEFSERFSFYGMRAVLTIYFIQAHGLSPTQAKLIFHSFVFTAYFTPIFGSILSDGFFGRYRVIIAVSIIYCIGHVLLTLSAIPSLPIDIGKPLDYTGLFTIALATGGLKPCLAAFAADQFPENRAAERTQFFSFFYFSINVGALLSQIITPILRSQHCLGSSTCFPLAFGVPAIFMFIATVIFCAGTPFYKITKFGDNIIWRIMKCCAYAARKRFSGTDQKKKHWLDHAYPKFDQSLIEDVKVMFNIMLLFLPVVLFWALFEQQGSTWVIQATQMDGRIGKLTILPEQIGVLNALFIILLVPLFEGLIYPTLARCNIWTSQLRRMGWGGFLAVISFLIAGFIQIAVDKTAVIDPRHGEARVVITNFQNCDFQVSSFTGGHSSFTIPSLGTSELDITPNISITGNENCAQQPGHVTQFWQPGNLTMEPGLGYAVAVFENDESAMIQYELKKTPDGQTRIYFLFRPSQLLEMDNLTVSVEQRGKVKVEFQYNITDTKAQFVDVVPGLFGSNEYEVYAKRCPNDVDGMDGNCTKDLLRLFYAETGAALVLTVSSDNSTRLLEVIRPNSVSIMWQIPQYLIISVAEVLFSISGLAFSYAQASPKMKSVFQAMWLLTSAFGNLIDVALSGSGLFENKPAAEFFTYGSIMAVVMCLFVVIAWRYKERKTVME